MSKINVPVGGHRMGSGTPARPSDRLILRRAVGLRSPASILLANPRGADLGLKARNPRLGPDSDDFPLFVWGVQRSGSSASGYSRPSSRIIEPVVMCRLPVGLRLIRSPGHVGPQDRSQAQRGGQGGRPRPISTRQTSLGLRERGSSTLTCQACQRRFEDLEADPGGVFVRRETRGHLLIRVDVVPEITQPVTELFYIGLQDLDFARDID